MLPTTPASIHDEPLGNASLREWVAALDQSVVKHEDVDRNLGSNCWISSNNSSRGDENPVMLGTRNVVRVCAVLKVLEASKVKWMEGWMTPWEL